MKNKPTPKNPQPKNKFRKAMKDVHKPSKLKTLRHKSRLEKYKVYARAFNKAMQKRIDEQLKKDTDKKSSDK